MRTEKVAAEKGTNKFLSKKAWRNVLQIRARKKLEKKAHRKKFCRVAPLLISLETM